MEARLAVWMGLFIEFCACLYILKITVAELFF